MCNQQLDYWFWVNFFTKFIKISNTFKFLCYFCKFCHSKLIKNQRADILKIPTLVKYTESLSRLSLQPHPDRRVILYILNCLGVTEKIYNIKIKNINVTKSLGNKYFYKFKTTNDEIVNSMFCSNVLLRFSVIAPAALPANAPRHIFHR